MPDGSYVFALPGHFYTVEFPSDSPSDILERFEASLKDWTSFRPLPKASEEPPSHSLPSGDKQKVRTRERIIGGITRGGDTLERGILKTGDVIAHGFEKGGASIKKIIKPLPEPTHVSEKTKRRVQTSKEISLAATEISAAALQTVLDISAALASSCADAIKDKVGKGSRHSSSSFTGACVDVAAAAVKVVGKVVVAGEQAGKQILSSAAHVATDLVHHRYGDEASEVAADGFATAGNVLESARAVRKVGLRRFGKSTAKRVVIETVHRNDSQAAVKAVHAEAIVEVQPSTTLNCTSRDGQASSQAIGDKNTRAKASTSLVVKTNGDDPTLGVQQEAWESSTVVAVPGVGNRI
eukprot:jgi/Mesvir1/12661/Mv02210-RA.1